jgi:maleylpyruvate isomerase
MPSTSDADRAGCRRADRLLLAGLDGLTDADARRPSLLPDWTVGHVLTHLARNAEANVWMAEGVLAGEVRLMYPGGAEQRAGDIEAGAGRPAAELVADVRVTGAAVHAAWDRLTPEQWATGSAMTRGGEMPAARLPRTRWREVLVHHADLGLGFTPDDWPLDYVRTEAPDLLRRLAAEPELLDDGAARALVVALMGRSGEPVRLPSVLN